MSDMPKLKPCPFCGDDAVLGKGVDEFFWMVMCIGCDAEVETPSQEDAIANWNRRASAIDTVALALRMVQFMVRCADERKHPDDCIDGMKAILDTALKGEDHER